MSSEVAPIDTTVFPTVRPWPSLDGFSKHVFNNNIPYYYGVYA